MNFIVTWLNCELFLTTLKKRPLLKLHAYNDNNNACSYRQVTTFFPPL